MTERSEHQAAAPIAAERIADDVHCHTCGYNLRTLPTDGVCPECGDPVSNTLPRDRLRDAAPEWLSMIRFGLAMSTAGCLLFSAERFGVLLTPVAWHTSFANPYSMAFVLCAAGAWALSARDKQTIETAWGTRRRLAMRWLFAVALAVHFFDWLLLRIDYWFPPAAYYAVANDIIRVSRPLGIGLQLYLVAELARRAPHRQLARWARVIGYWVAGAIGISGVVAITMPALPAGVSNPQYVATRHYCILIVAWGDAAAWLVSALVLAVMFKSIRERCAPVLDPRVDGDPSPANDPPVA